MTIISENYIVWKKYSMRFAVALSPFSANLLSKPYKSGTATLLSFALFSCVSASELIINIKEYVIKDLTR